MADPKRTMNGVIQPVFRADLAANIAPPKVGTPEQKEMGREQAEFLKHKIVITGAETLLKVFGVGGFFALPAKKVAGEILESTAGSIEEREIQRINNELRVQKFVKEGRLRLIDLGNGQFGLILTDSPANSANGAAIVAEVKKLTDQFWRDP